MGARAVQSKPASRPASKPASGHQDQGPPGPRASAPRRVRPRRPQAGITASILALSAGLGCLGLTAGLAAGPGSGGGQPVSALSVLGLLGVLTAAGALQVQFRYREEEEALDLFEAALTVVVFALPGLGVVLVTVAAKVLSQGIQRVRPSKAAFNVAQWSCASGLAALVFSTVRPQAPGGASALLPLMVAMCVVPPVNNLAMCVVRRLAYGEPLRRTFAAAVPTLGPGLANGAANLCVGVLFTATWAWAPAAAPLFLLPLGLMHVGGRALAAVQVDRARLRGLHRATHALAVPVDPRHALEPFLDEVRRCFTARAVDLVQVAGHRITVDRAHVAGPPSRRRERDAGGLAALLLVEEATAVAADAGVPLARALRREGWHSCLVAPLRGRDGEVRGALAVYDRTGFRGFDAAELAVLGALAGELASALDKGALLDAILTERGKLADIVNHTSDGIATVAQDGTVLSWNPGFERISGWPSAEVTGRRAMGRLTARDADGQAVAIERWADPAVELPQELQIVTRDGERRWLSCSTTEAPDGDGRPLLIVTARDVTGAYELRRAEQALADSESRFRALVRHSSDLLMVVDADGNVRYASPACRRIAGHGEGSWVGRSWFDIVHPEDAAFVRTAFEARRRSGGAGEPVEFRIHAADGSVRHIEALPNTLLDDPAVRGMVLNARDVTDRKRADALVASQVTVLDLIAHDAPLDDVLDELARTVEAHADGARCLVVMADTADDGTFKAADGSTDKPADGSDEPQVALAAAPSLTEAERAGPVAALWAAALRERAPVVVADTAGDPAWLEQSSSFGEGTRAVWVAPVMSRDQTRVLGAIALLHDRPRSPSRPDWRRLELATHLAEVAIEQTSARGRLAHLAQHDLLTRLPNRLSFTERSTKALERSRRTGEKVAVLFLDLDRFKVVNDSFGHEVGDQLLVELARRLERAVRPGDTLARFGGDEFTILCEGISGVDEAVGIAERVRQVLATPVQLAEGEVFVTGSIGIALADGSDQAEPGAGDTLVEDADAAMYRAKARGGDRQELFAEALRIGAKHRLAIQNSLHRALERGEFRVVYQPTVSLATDELIGVEALIRWLHPERGLLGPGEFIGLAEETGLIVPIGAQVLRQACQEAGRWRAVGPGGRPLTISVNLSARQFAHPELVGVVASALRETGTDPATLRLEITESVLMEDAGSTHVALRELRDLGVRLSIDDFGTGYSSLTYLKRFPVDELKVDRSFVDGLGSDAEDTAIVAAVVNLAHTLDLRVVAEGVETEAQSRLLRELGCDAAQGHWFGPAVPPELLGYAGEGVSA